MLRTAQIPTPKVLFSGAEQHSLSDRENDAAGKSEDNANGDKRPDGVGCRAEVREDGISDERGPVDAVIAEARRKPSGDRKAERQADQVIGRGPSIKARGYALKIPSRVRRENSIAWDVGQDDNIRQAGCPVQQNETPATQVNGFDHGHFEAEPKH